MKTIEKEYKLLEDLTVAYSFFFKLFDEEPSAELLELLKENIELLDEWPLQSTSDSKRGLELLKDAVNSSSKESIADILDDHMKLFIGPVAVAAPPWGSVYTENDKTIFGKSTLAVRELYLEHGLEVPNPNKEPDDHVRFESAFMNYLCMKALDALEKNNFPVYQYLMESLDEFVKNHIEVWVPQFAELLAEKSVTGYYKGLGFLLKGAVEETKRLLTKKAPAA